MTRTGLAFVLLAPLLLASAPPARSAEAQAAVPEQTAPWRASKLAGVPIYGPGNEAIGKVTDVLLDQDGTARFVIIGVGGFLGLGEKDVAVPFGQVTFSNQRLPPPTNPAGFANAPAGVSATPSPDAAAVPSDTLGTPTNPPMAGAVGAAPASPGTTGPALAAPSTGAPDHGSLTMSAAQLKSALAFHFAR